METREKVFAALAAVGLIIGIVALFIALGAKNDTQSDSEVAAQIKEQLETCLLYTSDAADE